MLEIQNLTKIYPDGTVALRQVSFTVEPGEFLVIIGLSGSGKSTLLRCINRLIDPTEGTIRWDGTDVTAAEPAELRRIRRQIGMIFQQFNLVRRSSVLSNVLAGRLGYVRPLPSLVHASRPRTGSWPGRPWSGWGSASRPPNRLGSFPAASSSGWASPAR
jgi:phosphonate transport system ATP-binding protein